MKRISKIFTILVWVLFVSFFIITSCEEYQSEEFKITDLDSKACTQLQREDSLGADTVQIIDLASIDSTIAVDTLAYNIDSVLVDTTLYFTWTNEMIYDSLNAKYKYVPEILDSLNARDIVVTNTSVNKIKLITPAESDTVYCALQTNSSSLTFYFNRSVSINIISAAGNIIRISNRTMPLETASGCTQLDENDVAVPFILSRYEISVPDNVSLLQLIKNEQTKGNTIHVSIL